MKKKYKKLTPLTINKGIERDYYAFMRFMSEQIKERFLNVVVEGLDKEHIKEIIHDESLQSKINSLFSDVIKKLKTQFHTKRLLQEIKKQIDKASYLHKQRFKKSVDYGFGIDISKLPEFKEYKSFINMAVKRNLSMVKSLRDENLTKLETSLRTAIEQGKSISNIKAVILKNYDVSKKKAAMIARNEIKNVTVMLEKKRMQNIGMDLYEWQTAEDERVRGNPSGEYPKAKPSHFIMNGKICKWSDPTVYSDDGIKWKKRIDKMPKSGAGEEVNCFLSGSDISFISKPLKFYKRFYTGSIVKITGESSFSISVTPNHPILTNRGWVFAKDINKSDKLIKSLLSYDSKIPNTEINNDHIVITDNIYNLLKIAFAFKRVCGVDVKFHGDVTNKEVEIVSIKSELSDRIKTFANHKIIKNILAPTYFRKSLLFNDSSFFHLFSSTLLSCNRQVSFPDLINPLLLSHKTPFVFFSFALASDFDILFNKSRPNNISASLKYFRDLIFAYSRIIKSDNLMDIKIYSINGLPFVESSITNVIHYDTSEYVYNLETEDSLYLYNGIVNHNCRCVSIPFIPVED